MEQDKPIELEGIWTAAQVRALMRAGWIGERTPYDVREVSSRGTISRYIIVPRRPARSFPIPEVLLTPEFARALGAALSERGRFVLPEEIRRALASLNPFLM